MEINVWHAARRTVPWLRSTSGEDRSWALTTLAETEYRESVAVRRGSDGDAY
ncbi:MAG: hypothetical protein OJF55_001090 [Rhodanobacteraceae bacterium]|nr:MAG: hypothetical protein OJF55_001090 [Rhodanobacteraceae bacterium]